MKSWEDKGKKTINPSTHLVFDCRIVFIKGVLYSCILYLSLLLYLVSKHQLAVPARLEEEARCVPIQTSDRTSVGSLHEVLPGWWCCSTLAADANRQSFQYLQNQLYHASNLRHTKGPVSILKGFGLWLTGLLIPTQRQQLKLRHIPAAPLFSQYWRLKLVPAHSRQALYHWSVFPAQLSHPYYKALGLASLKPLL